MNNFFYDIKAQFLSLIKESTLTILILAMYFLAATIVIFHSKIRHQITARNFDFGAFLWSALVMKASRDGVFTFLQDVASRIARSRQSTHYFFLVRAFCADVSRIATRRHSSLQESPFWAIDVVIKQMTAFLLCDVFKDAFADVASAFIWETGVIFIGKKVEFSLRLFDIFERNMVFIFLFES